MKVVALAGGVGGAKLLVGLARVVGSDLTAVVNTGDDEEIYGVHVSPDVDIVTYWLAGVADTQRGWGLAGDSFNLVDALGDLGVDNWFRLGDRDFATCLRRTMRLAAGARLSEVTDEVRRALSVASRLLPMSDDRVRTIIEARDGRRLSFQEYFVKERTRPDVAWVEFEGASEAQPAPGVLDAIAGADRVVVCPSNPILSIGPILSVPSIRATLRRHPSVVAVTPIVRGAALKGPADRILASQGLGASAAAVARLYSDFCNLFVVDASDEEQLEKVKRGGLQAVALDTVMHDHAASERLAKELLQL